MRSLRRHDIIVKGDVTPMRSFPAALISVLLVFPLFFCALSMIGVSTWALDRSFYAGILSDVRLYQIPDAISAASRVSVELPGNSRLSLRVSPRALKPILSSEYMRSQALSALGSVFDFLEGKTQMPDPVLDLAPVKKALLGREGKQFARALVEDLPVEAGQFRVSPGRLPESRPSSISIDAATAIVTAGLPVFVDGIPDRIRFSDYLSRHGEAADLQGWPGFPMIRGFVIADIILLFLAAAFWTAAAFLGGAGARQRLQWLGWSLLAPAAAVFLMGLVISLSLLSHWVRMGLAAAHLESLGFGPGFGAAIADAAQLTVQRVGVSFLAAGAIAAGVSLALLGGSWSMPRERPDGTAGNPRPDQGVGQGLDNSASQGSDRGTDTMAGRVSP
jgi:hypothetical protein